MRTSRGDGRRGALRILSPEPGAAVEHEQCHEQPGSRLEGDESRHVVEAEGEPVVGAALDQARTEGVAHHEQQPGGDDETAGEPPIRHDAGSGEHPDPPGDLEEQRPGAFRWDLGEVEGDEGRRKEPEAEQRDGESRNGAPRRFLDRDRSAKRRLGDSASTLAGTLERHRIPGASSLAQHRAALYARRPATSRPNRHQSRLARATTPKIAMMAPAPRFTQPSRAGVSDERISPTPRLRKSHQIAEPRKTPSTITDAAP